MASHPFRIVNVFTRDRGALTGNPLCVFENGAGMSAELMQALALQFNLSETTFILPPRANSQAHARVRIFTPRYEMPFAGHPTLGTAHVCRALKLGADSLVLDLEAGRVPVSASGDHWTLTALAPTWRAVDVSRETLAAALGLQVGDLGEGALWMKTGNEQLLVPLTSMEAVRRASPVSSTWRGIRNENGNSMAYVFCIEGGRASARFFFSQGDALLEDPATGSAAANLGGWCIAMKRSLPARLEISQGDLTGRPSTLLMEVNSLGQIFVGGDVVDIGRGTLDI